MLVATSIRWGSPSSLYFKMIERLNCVQNQITLADRVLIRNKVAAFIITGGQDNIQAVAGQMMMFFGELGFSLPQFPFVAHSRGWSAEDMEQNVEQVRNEGLASVASDKTEDLRRIAEDVIARAKEIQFGHFNRDDIIREAKKNLGDLIDRLNASELLARAKATALNTKDQVLSILSIPSQTEVVKLSRKITSLESRVNRLTRRAA